MPTANGRVLFGRTEELRALRGVIDELQRGHGAIVLIEGEAGIGKTTFCEAVADGAGSKCSVAWVACSDVGGLPAFWPWKHVLDQLGLPPITAPDPEADSRTARVASFDAASCPLTCAAVPSPSSCP